MHGRRYAAQPGMADRLAGWLAGWLAAAAGIWELTSGDTLSALLVCVSACQRRMHPISSKRLLTGRVVV